MPVCTSCGVESRDGARFCDSCGAALVAEPAGERRKLATLLFCDMSGSTAMGESVDAESVRDLMFRYFHEMRGAIERHEGTVEKFIGDAVLAVFGVPVVHEDDALRAVRAAAEMQDRLGMLNEELARRFGTRIALRIGVNTGEVVAGDASTRETIVTGDAVNVAARLEQAAAPGEVLLGEPTYRLVREAVAAEPVPPLAAKGKSEPIPAYRLVAVTDVAPRRRTAPGELVGREAELRRLRAAFEHCRTERRPVRLCLLGDPGVGKSRLTAEFVAGLDDAAVLTGRCLAYGEGITYWPLSEVVREAAGVRDEDDADRARKRVLRRLNGEPAAAVVAGRLLTAVGLSTEPASAEEIAWAARKLVSASAAEHPLVLVLDDLHWAEPPLLDLVESLDTVDARLLILGLARPELLELRPDWPVLRLEQLGSAEVGRIAASALGGVQLPPEVSARVTELAGGNPLFVEELAAMLVEEGHVVREIGRFRLASDLARIELPLTLESLLESRLERLAPAERAALERGAVEGEVFHRGSVAALTERARRDALPAVLRSLVERDVVAPAPASYVDEAAFRFRHILIRDASYRAAPKKSRAEWHARFADWLEQSAGERVGEVEEILGYHLEQAHAYRLELGPADSEVYELAVRAARRLISAARRAHLRGDAGAAASAFGRARSLLPEDDPERHAILAELAEVLVEQGSFGQAEEVIAEAEALDDPELGARLVVARTLVEMSTTPGFAPEAARRSALEAISAAESTGDDGALARLWRLVAWIDLSRSRGQEMEEAIERAVLYARLAGERREELEALFLLPMLMWFGPSPYERAQARIAELHAETADAPKVRSMVLAATAMLAAMRGRFAEARRLATESDALLDELAMHVLRLASAQFHGWIELLAGNPAAAERALRPATEELARLGETGFYGTNLSYLAEAVCRQGRYEEAIELSVELENVSRNDELSVAFFGAVRGRALAAGPGRIEEGEALARRAVEAADASDYPHIRILPRLHLGEILVLAGRAEAARKPLGEVLAIAERKGDLVFAEEARRRLAQLDR